jgi:hypothetical protein
MKGTTTMKRSLNNRWKLFVYIVLGFIFAGTAGSVYAQQIEEGETKRYRKIVPFPVVFYSRKPI